MLSTQLFRFMTRCDRETVWSILAPVHPSRGRYYGVPVVSDWAVGSTVVIGSCSGNGPAMVGEILAAERAALLSYSLGDQPDQPTTYVTWKIYATDAGTGGTVVRLYVDELEPGEDWELEAAWLPVLSALQQELDHCIR